MSAPSLDAGTQRRVAQIWRNALGATGRPSTDVESIEQVGLDAVVSVAIGAMHLLAGPPNAIAKLAALTRPELLDAEVVAAVLGPTAKPIGAACLSYASAPPAPGHRRTRAATAADLEDLRDNVTVEEWNESGLDELAHYWVACDGAVVAAISGYASWRKSIAQVGVLTAPAYRCRGFGYSAAAGAVLAALDAGLVPQWRSRVDNLGSRQLAERLGFVEVGAQCAVALDS